MKNRIALVAFAAAAVFGCGSTPDTLHISARNDLNRRIGFVVGAPGSYGTRNVDGELGSRLAAEVWYGVSSGGRRLSDTWVQFYALGTGYYFELRLAGVPLRGELYEKKADQQTFRGLIQQPLAYAYHPFSDLSGSRVFGSIEATEKKAERLRLTFERTFPDGSGSATSDWIFVPHSALKAKKSE